MNKTNWTEVLSTYPESWSLTPVKDKRPLRPSWQSEQALSKEVLAVLLEEGQELAKNDGSQWHCRWTGVGLRLGTVSGGLLAIDIDGELAEQAFFELQGSNEFPETVSWTSGKPNRRQLLFQALPEQIDLIFPYKLKVGEDVKQELDFRWDGAQSVLPPSRHPETGNYQWVNDLTFPVLPIPEWVIDFLQSKAVEKVPVTKASVIRETPLPLTFNPEDRWGDEDFARSYLNALSPWRCDDYECWLKVGMALHATSDSLLLDWERWSAQSSKFKPGECEKKWQKFSPNGTITLGTLGQYAKEDGWQSPFEGLRNSSKSRYTPRPNNAPRNPVLELDSPAVMTQTETYRRTEKSLYHALLPHLLEAEIELLGLLLLDLCNPYDVLGVIENADVFYDKRHQAIYKVILELHQEKSPTSLVPVLDRLKAKGELERIGGKQFLIDITDSQHNSLRGTKVADCATLLMDKWIRRQFIQVAHQLSILGHEQTTSIDAVLDEGERLVYGVRNLQPNKQTLHNSEVSYSAYELLCNPGNIYPTGFSALDARIVGLEPETLTVLAARSSMGKTAVALQMLTQFAVLNKKHSVYFSLEMTSKQLEFRLWSLISCHPLFAEQGFKPISGTRLKQHLSGLNPLTEEEAENVSRIASYATGLNISINDSRGITPSGIGSECRKLKSQHNNELGLVVIDYLQLFGEGKGDASERSNILLNVTRYFYNLAQELKCPIVLLAQVNRGPESRDNKRPSMSDLAQSGGIEWIADNIILLYRESYYKEDADDTIEMICSKVRQGETGTARMGFDLSCQLVYDTTESYL